ncbi:CIC11C00000002504 [Sungouiella intermedia]|uniref:CIC11C00000002504 n=1 Tax=Sungouiella intermedia TaxID=45354 RepID=A0A1L0C480_9ASCO|nr:CIC11C00000002504 [[Candida] intermedia]SGZ58417.1 CIC11C00000003762 [[Candida] intermedia]
MSEFPIVLVKNIPYDASTSLLYEVFGKFGHIHQLRISDGLVPQGSCYVVYSELASAKRAARELNGVNFHSRYLVAHMFAVDPEILREELYRLKEQHGIE